MVTAATTWLDLNTVRVDFSEGVDPTGLSNVANWSITPVISIVSATPDHPVEANSVTIITATQTPGVTYTLTLLFCPELAVCRWNPINKNSNYTVVAATDLPKALINVDTTGGPYTIYLPLGANCTDGDEVAVRFGAGATSVVVSRQGSDTMDGSASTQTLFAIKDCKSWIWHKDDGDWVTAP